MLKTDNSPAPDTQIRKDKMRLTVTNIYPAFQKNQSRKPDRKSGNGSIRFPKTMRKPGFFHGKIRHIQAHRQDYVKYLYRIRPTGT